MSTRLRLPAVDYESRSRLFWCLIIRISIAVRSEQVEYRFNLSTVARTEKILTAELHLFKLRPQASLTFNRHHFCQVCTMKYNELINFMNSSGVHLDIPVILHLLCFVSGECLSAAGHQREQQHTREEAAVLSPHPSPLYWLGSVHHHTSCKYPLLFKACVHS